MTSLSTAKSVISFHYHLKDSTGKTLEMSDRETPMQFLEGGGEIIPALELALSKMNPGDKNTVAISAPEAYGNVNPEMVVKVPRENFPEHGKGLTVGDHVHAQEAPMVFKVVEVGLEMITLDGNHPLAGQDLVFDVELVEKRDATAEELEHGHAHGPHGHGHDHDGDDVDDEDVFEKDDWDKDDSGKGTKH